MASILGRLITSEPRTRIDQLGAESGRCKRFRSHQGQGFLFAHSFIDDHFRLRRHHMAAGTYRAVRAEAFKVWRQETCTFQAI